jgi:drug/metabolite transporter (DMT)-like permease
MSVLSEVALSQANAFSFLVPFFGLTMGVLFYNETLSVAVIFGIGLAMAGVALVSRNGVVDTADLGMAKQ